MASPVTLALFVRDRGVDENAGGVAWRSDRHASENDAKARFAGHHS
jgi:hypothetical protein